VRCADFVDREYRAAQVAREIGCSLKTVVYHGRRDKPPDMTTWAPKGRLALLDREEIFLGLASGLSFTEIAGRLGCAVSTVSREVNHNRGRDLYRASTAHRHAFQQARRPKRSDDVGVARDHLPVHLRPGPR
jgi:IS30 family transposase